MSARHRFPKSAVLTHDTSSCVKEGKLLSNVGLMRAASTRFNAVKLILKIIFHIAITFQLFYLQEVHIKPCTVLLLILVSLISC